MNQRTTLIYMKLYTYQIIRSLAYIHSVPGVCHRDVNPQNLLVDPLTDQVKICDFGSAKNTQPPLIFGWLVVSLLNSFKANCCFWEKMQWTNSLRCTALETYARHFFDELWEPHVRLPNNRPLPPLFNFKQELAGASLN
ncbi:unnamed protein product [Citrullus colocynthis]|uniref:Protein kinase domain-containing protein n=1 Tax=Citrullus colocynthis TaxID=252529 RepID=A0ABP0XVE2_9ROSI